MRRANPVGWLFDHLPTPLAGVIIMSVAMLPLIAMLTWMHYDNQRRELANPCIDVETRPGSYMVSPGVWIAVNQRHCVKRQHD